MTPRAPFLPKKRNIISKHTGTSRLSPSHLVELTLSFLMVPPWTLRSSSSPRTINFPLADTIAPTAPFFAQPLPNIHTSSLLRHRLNASQTIPILNLGIEPSSGTVLRRSDRWFIPFRCVHLRHRRRPISRRPNRCTNHSPFIYRDISASSNPFLHIIG